MAEYTQPLLDALKRAIQMVSTGDEARIVNSTFGEVTIRLDDDED